MNQQPDCFAWKNNSVGIYDPVNGIFRKSRNPFAINGVADILGCYRGKMLAIEVKTETGKASFAQMAFISKIKKCGGVAFLAKSVDDVREMLQAVTYE